MRARDIMAAFEASGLDERYRVVAEMASRGNDWAWELVSDAMAARELRIRGYETFEAHERRRNYARRVDRVEAEKEQRQ